MLSGSGPNADAMTSPAGAVGRESDMTENHKTTTESLRVSEIWRYPIKSVGGERIAVARVTELGILGDRGWGIFDIETGTVLTARRAPALLFASARLSGDGVAITLPDGSAVNSTDTDGNQRLSAWLERSVELRAASDEGGTYEVPLDFERDENWVSWQGPGGAWHDSPKTRVSLVSRDSLRNWDPRRFRANVILDGAGEDELVGRTIGLGTVALAVQKQIDRCVIVTRPQPGIDRDLDVLRTINADRARTLCIGALVSQEGTLSEGDTITT